MGLTFAMMRPFSQIALGRIVIQASVLSRGQLHHSKPLSYTPSTSLISIYYCFIQSHYSTAYWKYRMCCTLCWCRRLLTGCCTLLTLSVPQFFWLLQKWVYQVAQDHIDLTHSLYFFHIRALWRWVPKCQKVKRVVRTVSLYSIALNTMKCNHLIPLIGLERVKPIDCRPSCILSIWS